MVTRPTDLRLFLQNRRLDLSTSLLSDLYCNPFEWTAFFSLQNGSANKVYFYLKYERTTPCHWLRHTIHITCQVQIFLVWYHVLKESFKNTEINLGKVNLAFKCKLSNFEIFKVKDRMICLKVKVQIGWSVYKIFSISSVKVILSDQPALSIQSIA